jgi:YVTN family beta-propeller protein
MSMHLKSVLTAALVAGSALVGLGAIAAPSATAATSPYAVSTISSFSEPDGVVLTPNGKTAYVIDEAAAIGRTDAPDGEDLMFVVSTATNTITDTISAASFDNPVAEAINPAGTDVYVLNVNGTVSVVSTATNAVTAVIGTPNSTSAGGFEPGTEIAISPSGTTAYTLNAGLDIVSVLNLTTNSVTRTIEVASPGALALTPDGKDLYVVSGTSVEEISTATDTVVGSVSGLPSGGFYVSMAVNSSTLYLVDREDGIVDVVSTATNTTTGTITGFTGGFLAGSAMSPDGTMLAVSAADSVAIVDTTTKTIADAITVNSAVAGPALAFTPDGGAVYAAGTGADVAVISMTSHSVTEYIPTVTGNPDAVAASPDGKSVYVDSPSEFLGGSGGGITVISTATENATTNFPAGDNPDGLAVSPDGKTLYVADVGSEVVPQAGTVSAVNTATGGVTATITVGHQPEGIAVSPDGTKVYVANYSDNTVSVIDTATHSAINTINVGSNPTTVVASPDGKTVYVGTSSGVAVISTVTDTVTTTIPGTTSFLSWGLAISPDGKTVYSSASDSFPATVAVINAATHAVTKTIDIGTGCPYHLAVSPDGGTLYGSGGCGVTVVSTATGQATTITDPSFFNVPDGTDDLQGLAVRPDGKALYVADEGNSSVHVLTPVTVAPKISSGAAATFTVGAKGSFTVTATGTPAPTLTETGTLPKGVTFKNNGNGTATVSGTPAAGTGKAYAITIQASNGVGTPASQAFKLTVHQAAGITSKAAATFTAGKKGTFEITTSGYPAATTITESGTLPKGVTFKNNQNGTATVSGTPAAGTGKAYAITMKASNGIGATASQAFRLTVDQAPAISTAAKATFVYKKKGSFEIKASGYPVVATITESGSLPKGLTFKNNKNGTATISGTAQVDANKTYTIVVSASNGVGSTARQTFKLTLKK